MGVGGLSGCENNHMNTRTQGFPLEHDTVVMINVSLFICRCCIDLLLQLRIS